MTSNIYDANEKDCLTVVFDLNQKTKGSDLIFTCPDSA
jgi:hypothetical protein